MAANVPLYRLVRQEYIPSGVDEAEFEVNVTAPEGTSAAGMDEAMLAIERELKNLPAVRLMLASVGGGFLNAVNDGRIFVRIAPHEERIFSITRLLKGLVTLDPLAAFRGNYSQRDVMQRIRAIGRTFPDLRISVRYLQSFNIGGGNWDIDFVIRGPELEQLARFTEALRDRAPALGVIDSDTTLKLNKPELRVRIDRARAADLGVRTQDVAATLRLMVGGDQEVTRFRDNASNEDYDVQLRLVEEDRRDPETIARLYVARDSGEMIRLDNVVRLEEGRSPSRVDRLDRQRQANLRGMVAPGYALADRWPPCAKPSGQLGMPAAYTTAVSGRGRELERTFREFGWAFMLSVLFMYMVLAAQYESLVNPFIILLSLPLAVPFALLSLYLTGDTLNLYSALGMLVLFGVVAKNAILQIDHTLNLRATRAAARAGHPRGEPGPAPADPDDDAGAGRRHAAAGARHRARRRGAPDDRRRRHRRPDALVVPDARRHSGRLPAVRRCRAGAARLAGRARAGSGGGHRALRENLSGDRHRRSASGVGFRLSATGFPASGYRLPVAASDYRPQKGRHRYRVPPSSGLSRALACCRRRWHRRRAATCQGRGTAVAPAGTYDQRIAHQSGGCRGDVARCATSGGTDRAGSANPGDQRETGRRGRAPRNQGELEAAVARLATKEELRGGRRPARHQGGAAGGRRAACDQGGDERGRRADPPSFRHHVRAFPGRDAAPGRGAARDGREVRPPAARASRPRAPGDETRDRDHPAQAEAVTRAGARRLLPSRCDGRHAEASGRGGEPSDRRPIAVRARRLCYDPHMRFALPALVVLALSPVLAQQPSPQRMRADLDFLCSPPLEGRASLSQGADATAWFLATEMRKAGLEPADGSSYLQRFDLVPVRLDRERSSLTVRREGSDQRFDLVSVFFPDPRARSR